MKSLLKNAASKKSASLSEANRKLLEEATAQKDPKGANPPASDAPSGAPGGSFFASPSATSPPPDSVEGKGAKAFSKAQKMGEQLKSGLRQAEGGADSGKAGEAASKAKLPPGADPSNPKTQADLALAATTGFKGAFDALGLKTAPGPVGTRIVDKDGRPASDARLKELKQRIASEPKALMARPDFFSVIGRGKFAALKQDIQDRPALRETAFKHMDLTQPGARDFVHTESCATLSGGCNAHTTEMSYRKGELVSPEDLRKVSDSLVGAEIGAIEEDSSGSGGKGAPDAPRRMLDKEARKKIFARLNAIAGEVKAAFGLGGGDAASSAGSAASVGGSPAGWDGSGSKVPIELSASPKARALAEPPTSAKGLSAAGARVAAVVGGKSSRDLWAVAMVVAALLILLLRRRD